MSKIKLPKKTSWHGNILNTAEYVIHIFFIIADVSLWLKTITHSLRTLSIFDINFLRMLENLIVGSIIREMNQSDLF